MIFPCRVGVGEPHASFIYKIEAIGGGLMIVVGTRKNEMRPHVHNFPPRLMQTAVGDDSNVLLRHLDFCGHRITSFSMMDGRKCSYTFYVNCCTGYISIFSSVIRCFCGERHPSVKAHRRKASIVQVCSGMGTALTYLQSFISFCSA